MAWTGKAHPVEMLAERAAPVALALAAGWSARLAHLPLAGIAACGALALALGSIAMRLAGNTASTVASPFEPAVFEPDEALDELLLDNPVGELLLDDPLIEAAPDSRVVRLFARQDPTPGELVLRISDFLGEDNRSAAPAPVDQDVPDASAALHAALANIRASLR
jgi:hypothetical protein